MNENFSVPQGPVDLEKENKLKIELITRVPSASSLEDLAHVKYDSLDLNDQNRMDVHRVIVKRMEDFLREETLKVQQADIEGRGRA